MELQLLFAVAAEFIVQKIRSRVGPDADSSIVKFPNEACQNSLTQMLRRSPGEQQVLMVALLWLEASALEVEEVPTDLSTATLSLIAEEDVTLRAVCTRVPPHVLLQKAGASIPRKEIRDQAKEVVAELITRFESEVEGQLSQDGKDALKQELDDILASNPTTVQIMALVHLVEFACLHKGRKYRELDAVAASVSQLCVLEHALETVCRISLVQAIELARICLGLLSEKLRKSKFDVLNRLYVAWQVSPTEEQLAHLHMLTLPRQVQVLLGIERDIELVFHSLGKQAREEQSQQLRSYCANFDRLLLPYMREEDLTSKGGMKRKMEEESGHRIEPEVLAKIREGCDFILNHLKDRYGWRPAMKTRRELSRVNFVARLSSLHQLAQMSECLHADEYLRVFLREANHRKMGMEVFEGFHKWQKLQEGRGMKYSKLKVVTKEEAEKYQRLYDEWNPDNLRYPGQQARFQPYTPALATGGMTPGMPMSMTPGLAGPGTPAGGTPRRAPTPQWQPNMTPVNQSSSGTPQRGTPQRRVGPGTPGDVPPATPGLAPFVPPGGAAGYAARGTPSGMPPGTPAYPASGTPSGMPPGTPAYPARGTPSGMPPGTPAFAASGTPSGMPPGTPAYPARGTPSGMPPGTPAYPASGTPGGLPPGTPARGTPASPLPGTPSFAGMRPPATPGLPPATPSPQAPQTPGMISPGAKKEEDGPSVPYTPAGPGAPVSPKVEGTGEMTPAAPTPGVVMPFTPSVPAPGTANPRGMPMTPGGLAVPFTPSAPAPVTPGGLAVPFTPSAPAPSTANPRGMPMTPGGLAVPFTPAGPAPGTAAATMPFTPGMAMPFTPGVETADLPAGTAATATRATEGATKTEDPVSPDAPAPQSEN